jgi:uncharacterized membrane protein YjgN (DUF898 family)
MSMAEQSAAPRGETIAFEQRAKLGDFFGLSLKNGFLNLITLTLYRFWGKTEVRRRVWSTTYLNGEPLEYTGRGGELFKGFLFALAVFGVPFLLLSFGAQLLGPAAAAAIVLPLYLLIFFLFGFGMFTAFRYMASRTVWRGVRFELKGSPVDYAWRYIGYALLSAVTLGWFWPAAQRRLSGALWDGLSFGDRPLRFDMEAARKVSVYRPFVLGMVVVVVGYLVLIGAAFGGLGQLMPAAGTANEHSLADALIVMTVAAFALLVVAVALAPYQAAQLRSVAAGVKIDDAGFRLELSWPQMAWLTLSNIFLAAISLGFLMPYVQARTTRFLVSRLSSEGAVDLSHVRQAARGPKTAEGLADAFGMAPI